MTYIYRIYLCKTPFVHKFMTCIIDNSTVLLLSIPLVPSSVSGLYSLNTGMPFLAVAIIWVRSAIFSLRSASGSKSLPSCFGAALLIAYPV